MIITQNVHYQGIWAHVSSSLLLVLDDHYVSHQWYLEEFMNVWKWKLCMPFHESMRTPSSTFFLLDQSPSPSCESRNLHFINEIIKIPSYPAPCSCVSGSPYPIYPLWVCGHLSTRWLCANISTAMGVNKMISPLWNCRLSWIIIPEQRPMELLLLLRRICHVRPFTAEHPSVSESYRILVEKDNNSSYRVLLSARNNWEHDTVLVGWWSFLWMDDMISTSTEEERNVWCHGIVKGHQLSSSSTFTGFTALPDKTSHTSSLLTCPPICLIKSLSCHWIPCFRP